MRYFGGYNPLYTLLRHFLYVLISYGVVVTYSDQVHMTSILPLHIMFLLLFPIFLAKIISKFFSSISLIDF